MQCYATLCYAMLHCAVQCYATLYYAMLCCATLCSVVLCCAMLHCAALHCATLYYAMLHCAVLRYAILCCLGASATTERVIFGVYLTKFSLFSYLHLTLFHPTPSYPIHHYYHGSILPYMFFSSYRHFSSISCYHSQRLVVGT